MDKLDKQNKPEKLGIIMEKHHTLTNKRLDSLNMRPNKPMESLKLSKEPLASNPANRTKDSQGLMDRPMDFPTLNKQMGTFNTGTQLELFKLTILPGSPMRSDVLHTFIVVVFMDKPLLYSIMDLLLDFNLEGQTPERML